MNSRSKIVKLEKLRKIINHLRKQGKKIAFTNGCFDILHHGHIQYLEKAKKQNRVLIVGLNSDTSVRKIKGQSRPINFEYDRAALLAALSCVDYVTIFSEATPLNVIKKIKPDVLIKGNDWKSKEVVGGNIVMSNGGKVELIHYWDKYSTSKLIQAVIDKGIKLK